MPTNFPSAGFSDPPVPITIGAGGFVFGTAIERGDDVLADDRVDVSGDHIGNDILDCGQHALTFGHDTVLAGIDHTLATSIEIGNATAHQGTLDAAGYPGVTLTDDVVTILGSGGTDFVRNVETISLVKSGDDRLAA